MDPRTKVLTTGHREAAGLQARQRAFHTRRLQCHALRLHRGKHRIVLQVAHPMVQHTTPHFGARPTAVKGHTTRRPTASSTETLISMTTGRVTLAGTTTLTLLTCPKVIIPTTTGTRQERISLRPSPKHTHTTVCNRPSTGIKAQVQDHGPHGHLPPALSTLKVECTTAMQIYFRYDLESLTNKNGSREKQAGPSDGE